MEKKVWKVWGPRPISFQLKNTGNFYFVGSDAASYLRMFRGKLYNQFPKLTLKKATEEDISQIHVSC
jgi:hypothetical protein